MSNRVWVLACALFVLSGSGCIAPHRLADLQDCGELALGPGIGLDAQAKIGAITQPALGMPGSGSLKFGCDGRLRTGMWGEGQLVWPLALADAAVGQAFSGGGSTSPWNYTCLREYSIREDGNPLEEEFYWLPIFARSSKYEPLSYAEALHFQVGGTLGVASARVGINLLETIDFILGFFSLDIANDDALRRDRSGAYPTAALLKLIKDADPKVRAQSARNLGWRRGTRVTSALVAALDDPVAENRVVALYALGEHGDIRAVPEILPHLDVEDNRTVCAALQTLGKLKDAEAVPAILERLAADDDQQVRLAALHTLGEIGDRRAVPEIIRMLGVEDRKVRYDAIRCLVYVFSDDPRILKPLIESLGDEDSLVRGTAMMELRRLSGEDFGTDAEAWRRWLEETAKTE